MIGNCVVNVGLMLAHTRTTCCVNGERQIVVRDSQVTIAVNGQYATNLAEYHFHFLAPLAVALLQTLHQLLVAANAHTLALRKRRREFGESARIDCPPILGSLVLHPYVTFVGHAVNCSNFTN